MSDRRSSTRLGRAAAGAISLVTGLLATDPAVSTALVTGITVLLLSRSLRHGPTRRAQWRPQPTDEDFDFSSEDGVSGIAVRMHIRRLADGWLTLREQYSKRRMRSCRTARRYRTARPKFSAACLVT